MIDKIQDRVLAIQSVNEPRVDGHVFSERAIGGDPVCCASTLRAAVKLDDLFVPSVGSGAALATLKDLSKISQRSHHRNDSP